MAPQGELKSGLLLFPSSGWWRSRYNGGRRTIHDSRIGYTINQKTTLAALDSQWCLRERPWCSITRETIPSIIGILRAPTGSSHATRFDHRDARLYVFLHGQSVDFGRDAMALFPHQSVCYGLGVEYGLTLASIRPSPSFCPAAEITGTTDGLLRGIRTVTIFHLGADDVYTNYNARKVV